MVRVGLLILLASLASESSTVVAEGFHLDVCYSKQLRGKSNSYAYESLNVRYGNCAQVGGMPIMPFLFPFPSFSLSILSL